MIGRFDCGRSLYSFYKNELQSDLMALKVGPGQLPNLRKPEAPWRSVRAVVTLTALGALVYGVGRMANVQWGQVGTLFKGRIALWKLLTIVGSVTLTAGAVATIFYRAIHGKETASQKLTAIHGASPYRGKFWDNRDWVCIKIKGKGAVESNILDLSSLEKEGNGYCFAYQEKGRGEAEVIALESGVLGGPLYPIAITIYQVVGWAIASYKNKTNPLIELGKSLWRIVRSPFYALAYFIAQIAVFIDPLNGRKLVANIERDWNEGVLVDNGCALALCWHPFKEDKGMSLGKKEHSAFYIQGCFQPTAILKFENFECKKVQATNGFGEWTVEGVQNV